MTEQPNPRPATLVGAALLAVVAAYALGLRGPFLLDDHANLAPAWHWYNGDLNTFTALFGNGSGPLGRPLAYLTLMLNSQAGGANPFGYKLFNLLLHLAGTVLCYGLVRRILSLAAPNAPRAPWAAVVVAAAWALHPLQVSTVLYVVQRMAILAALAQMAALWVYLDARALLATDPAKARRMLFAGVPLLVVAGLLAKETALLVPLLAAVLELGLFRGQPRPREVRWFFLLFLALPVVAGIVALPALADRLAQGYDGREFDLAQRLLTQPRVLGDYFLAWLWPDAHHLGLYRDGYAHSTAWNAPLSTLLWPVAWLALLAVAWRYRARAPLCFVGVAWFLCGHALEAGPWPLEPYFEHRNYLPSLGLWLAATGLAWPWHARVPRLAWQGLLAALLLALAALTAQRAWHWSTFDRVLAHEAPPHGEVSRRLEVDRVIRANETGDVAREREALAVLATGSPGNRAAAALWTAISACGRGEALPPAARGRLFAEAPDVITHSHVSWLALLAKRTQEGRCRGIAPTDLAEVAQRWRAEARKPLPPGTAARMADLEARLAAMPGDVR